MSVGKKHLAVWAYVTGLVMGAVAYAVGNGDVVFMWVVLSLCGK